MGHVEDGIYYPDELNTNDVVISDDKLPSHFKRPRVFKDRLDHRWSVEYVRAYGVGTSWLVCGSFEDAITNANSIYIEHYQPFKYYGKVEEPANG